MNNDKERKEIVRQLHEIDKQREQNKPHKPQTENKLPKLVTILFIIIIVVAIGITAVVTFMVIHGDNFHWRDSENNDIAVNEVVEEDPPVEENVVLLTSIEDFINSINDLDIEFVEEYLEYLLIGAINGMQLAIEDEVGMRLEIYEFEGSVNETHNEELEQLLEMDNSEYQVIVNHNFLLVISNNFPQKDEIIRIFGLLH